MDHGQSGEPKVKFRVKCCNVVNLSRAHALLLLCTLLLLKHCSFGFVILPFDNSFVYASAFL
jgi:hypothetical protein